MTQPRDPIDRRIAGAEVRRRCRSDDENNDANDAIRHVVEIRPAAEAAARENARTMAHTRLLGFVASKSIPHAVIDNRGRGRAGMNHRA
jgi:hypothetical protein